MGRARRGKDRDQEIAEEAGVTYAEEQLTSDHFDYWVWEQLDEASKLKPEEIAPGLDLASVARGGRAALTVAKNMLEQLRWDTERDLGEREVRERLAQAGVEDPDDPAIHRAFWGALRTALESKDNRVFLAEEVVTPAADRIVKG